MKSKKKMLLALGAMSAAAIGAGATSTFAWYTASSAAVSVASNNIASTVTTVDSKLDGIDVKATWSAETNLNALPLTHLDGSGNIETYVINAAGNLVKGTLPDDNVGYGSAVVTFGMADGKVKADYIPYTGNYTAEVIMTGADLGNGYSLRIGSVSAGKFTDEGDGSITVTFKIATDGTVSGTATIYARVDGGAITNLNNPEAAKGEAGATAAKIKVGGSATRTGDYSA